MSTLRNPTTPNVFVAARHVGKPQPTRPVVTGRRDCITGEFPSGKPAMGHRMVAYEGMLARDFLLLLEDDPGVVAYDEESAAFDWFDGESWHSYTPDFGVDYDDGRRVCYEVKPIHRLGRLHPNFADGVAAGAVRSGYDAFEIWTEREIDALKVANASLIASERTFLVDETELHAIRAAGSRNAGPVRVSDLRRSSGLGERGFRAVVTLLARRELLQADRSVALDDNAFVRRPLDRDEQADEVR